MKFIAIFLMILINSQANAQVNTTPPIVVFTVGYGVPIPASYSICWGEGTCKTSTTCTVEANYYTPGEVVDHMTAWWVLDHVIPPFREKCSDSGKLREVIMHLKAIVESTPVCPHTSKKKHHRNHPIRTGDARYTKLTGDNNISYGHDAEYCNFSANGKDGFCMETGSKDKTCHWVYPTRAGTLTCAKVYECSTENKNDS